MRILVDLQPCQSASRERGIGRYSLALAEAIVATGGSHDVSLLLNAAFPDSVESLRDRFREVLPDERMHVFAVPGPTAEIEAANQWRARAAEFIRDAFVTSLRPDVVLVSSLFEGFVDDASVTIDPVPDRVCAATLYDLIPLVRAGVLAAPEARLWYERKLEALGRADLLLAISEHARSEARSALGIADDRIAVVSAAAAACFRPPDTGSAQRDTLARLGIRGAYVLYAGGFDERKNVSRLIAGYGSLPPPVRAHYPLVLAGAIDEAMRRNLRNACARAGLAPDHYRFTGYVDDADLVALYGGCAVFAFPSLHEGFGLPVLEAMSCGAAVIASNATSIPEVVGRADALFDPVDAASIAERLHAVLTDPGFASALKQHGVSRAKRFSWAATAGRAVDALASAHASKSRRTIAMPVHPTVPATLAFVSPLPPERTGVAAYAVELLAALRAHYRIELVTDQKRVDLPSGLRDLPLRSGEWFDANARSYDRRLYQLGNSPFHQRMFGMLERHPGAAVMHDIYLGGVLNWMELHGIEPAIFSRALFAAHGYPALVADRDRGREFTIDEFPCSFNVIESADGIIVHSAHAMRVAASSFRIRTDAWRRIPQLRGLPDPSARDAARRSLGIAADAVVFCSFGFVDATKLDHLIVDAWRQSRLDRDARHHLIFVGENHGGDYGRQLLARIGSSARMRITGYVDPASFDRYLEAADAAIQLRGVTRGETSRTVLDCLAHGIPVIANASGSIDELPDDVLLRLPSPCTAAMLTDAISRLASDADLRERLGRDARRYIAVERDPVRIGHAFRDAIERFASGGPRTRHGALVRSVAAIDTDPPAAAADWRAAAQSIAVDLWRPPMPQLFVDVSVLARQDLHTGIERVARAVLRELLEHAPAGFRVEPVVAADGCYRYARRFTCRWLGLPTDLGEDAPIEPAPGDAFLGLDWAADIVPDQEAVLRRYRTLGVVITFVVYDLLPVLRPDFYPPGIDAMHRSWLGTIGAVSDVLLCISNAVADELVAWLEANALQRTSALGIGVIPLGADVEQSVPTRGLPADIDAALDAIAARPSALVVGTVEPRKGHEQALEAFEWLWRNGEDWNLVIVGKQGWMVDDLAARLRNHRERNARLFWYEQASDEWLARLYANVDVLLAPSLGEGYGLPLIEAARHAVPLLVRDLPVYREIAGIHATYFEGSGGEGLARALRDWKRDFERGDIPDSRRIDVKRWRDTVDAIVAALVERRWSRRWRADAGRRERAGSALRQVDFSQPRLAYAVDAVKGLSGREPWGRWSDADLHPHVEIRFREPLPAQGTIALTARAFGPNVGQPIRIRIGSQASELRFDAHDTTAIASYALSHGPRSLEIEPPLPTPPQELGISRDTRRLGIGLVRLTIAAT